MIFFTVSALSLAIIAVNSVAAVQYNGYASSVECSGASFGCNDNGGLCCGPFPTGFGESAQFINLPAGTQGQGYTGSTCAAFLFSVFGPGTKCFNSGGGTPFTHLNWFHSAGRAATGSDAVSTQCAQPNAFTYADGTGIERTIKVPTSINASEAIAALYLVKNFDALAAYEATV
jgi:hypothetical protein